MKRDEKLRDGGFTLIEILVAITIFAIVMMIAVAALLALVDGSRKAQALESVMNNLNFALENMTRSIRVGTLYHCQTTNTPSSNLQTPQDCTTGGVLLAFEGATGDTTTNSDQIIYRLNGAQLERSTDGGGTFIAITAPEVNIQSFAFYVSGTTRGDGQQPRVLMTIRGIAGVSPKVQTPFYLESMASQRLLDL